MAEHRRKRVLTVAKRAAQLFALQRRVDEKNKHPKACAEASIVFHARLPVLENLIDRWLIRGKKDGPLFG